MTNINSLAKSLNPVKNLKGKSNYQKFILIDKEGKTTERIILFIHQIEVREQIICIHFLSRYIQMFVGMPTGIKFLSRDKPWDFEIELSNSEKLILEITSIADEVSLFRNFKYQERIYKKSNEKQIEFHEMIKLNGLFPMSEIQKEIELLKSKGISKKQLIDNPYYGKEFIFESSISDDLLDFDIILKTAIDKKIEKKHKGKEDVILIIDNRTVTYKLEDIIEHLESLNDYFENLPFKEVWIYTGYYSDFDGNNAEYSFVPLKLDKLKIEKLKSILK